MGEANLYFRRIKDLRTDHDMSQAQIAEMLGCHEGVYRRYEQGVRDIPIWALLRLAEFYDVSIDYLLGVSNNKRKYGE